MKQILFSVLFLTAVCQMQAQVVVKPNLDVTIGDTLSQFDIFQGKQTINSVNKNFGLVVRNELSSNSILNNQIVFGQYSLLNVAAPPFGASFTKKGAWQTKFASRQGYYNSIIDNYISETYGGNNGAETTALYNEMDSVRNVSLGVYNAFKASNKFRPPFIYSLRSYIRETPYNPTTPGGDTATALAYGVYNDFEMAGPTINHGVFNTMKINQNSQGDTYGVRTEIKLGNSVDTNANFNPGARYGIYSEVPVKWGISNIQGYAGYFVGNVAINGVIINSSDAKLKENVESVTNATDIIKQFSPKKYDLISERGLVSRKKHYGFLAQDVEQIMPDLVSTLKQPGKTKTEETVIKMDKIVLEKDANGNLQSVVRKEDYVQRRENESATETLKALNYTEIIPLLLQAIKEQQAIIEQLQRDVEILKRR
jgi:hypothetical protein